RFATEATENTESRTRRFFPRSLCSLWPLWQNNNRMIYLDHNASAPLRPEALKAMRPWLGGAAGNPASAHAAGRHARRRLEDAREQIASLLGAGPDEVVFTSGATEANNLALFGLAGEPRGRIIS